MLKSSSASKGSVAIPQHLSSFSTEIHLSNGVQMYEKAGRGTVTFSSWDQDFFFSIGMTWSIFITRKTQAEETKSFYFIDKQQRSEDISSLP